MALSGPRPRWLTFDCYGTLAQWDEGLLHAVTAILARHGETAVEPHHLIAVYDKYEHTLEQTPPFRKFRDVAGQALQSALQELGLSYDTADIDILTDGIATMPPFPEVPETLGVLRAAGFKLCIISNTDDDIIAGNVAQMSDKVGKDTESPVDRIITAQQAQAYKPSGQIFEHAHNELGVIKDDIVHICASPHLDLAAARDMGFRTVWINRGTGREPLPDYWPDAELADLEGVPGLFQATGWI